MRVIDKMAEAARQGIRSFLRIEPAQASVLHIHEKMDFNTNAAKNQIWYRGDSRELAELYALLPGDNTRFWKAIPTAGRDIEKTHIGIPAITVDTLTSIVLRDMNGVELEGKYKELWDSMEKEKKFKDILEKAITGALVIGDGAFRISFDPEISMLPILEFISGEQIEVEYRRGRIHEITFRTPYRHGGREYILEEIYGKGYIRTTLLLDGKELPLNAIPATAKLSPAITFDGDFMLAEHFKIFDSPRYKDRGGSIFDKKTDCYDNLDECWSQWMDALRKGRTKEYIPDTMLPRNPNTGEVLMPNPFDNAYIKCDTAMTEDGSPKIDVVQPAIPVESYLGTYMTALDLCLQGIISPSTIGIDVKKLDNAEAQREKEKATLYTRNRIIEAIQNTVPTVITNVIKANAVWNKQPVEDVSVDISFGEYANPSFESQVETISKARTGQIMSVEASVEELYGDSRDDEWKREEIARLKAEQGIQDMENPGLNLEGVIVDESGSGTAGIQYGPKGISGTSESGE